MDGLRMLEADHEKVAGLFEKYESAGPRAKATKQKLLEQIAEELAVHAFAEEHALYPIARNELDSESDVSEAFEEHLVVKWELASALGAGDGERRDAKVSVLKELVEHHVKEEEKQLFPKLRKQLTRGEREELGELLAATKKVAPRDVGVDAPPEPADGAVALDGLPVPPERFADAVAFGG